MAYAFFRVPSAPEPGAVEELNRFLRTHSVLAVHREWVGAGDGSFWAFCIQYSEPGQPGAKPGAAAKVDYKELLTETQFRLYVKLREVRKHLAERDRVPVFTVFTNEQLAEMTKIPVRKVEDLRGIAGVGEARVEKYGREILAAFSKDAPDEDGQDQLAVERQFGPGPGAKVDAVFATQLCGGVMGAKSASARAFVDFNRWNATFPA